MRRVGASVYPDFFDTLVGKAIFMYAGGSYRKAITLTPRAFKVSGRPATAEVDLHEDNTAIVRLRGAWIFPDCYYVGVFEGSLTAFKVQGQVLLKRLDLADVDLRVTWR